MTGPSLGSERGWGGFLQLSFILIQFLTPLHVASHFFILLRLKNNPCYDFAVMAGVLDSSAEGEAVEQEQNPMPRHCASFPADLQASSGVLLSLGTCESEVYVGFFSFILIHFNVCDVVG